MLESMGFTTGIDIPALLEVPKGAARRPAGRAAARPGAEGRPAADIPQRGLNPAAIREAPRRVIAPVSWRAERELDQPLRTSPHRRRKHGQVLGSSGPPCRCTEAQRPEAMSLRQSANHPSGLVTMTLGDEY